MTIHNMAAAESLRNNPLRIGIATRALFNLETEHRIFENEGVVSYAKFQRANENVILEPGTGFQVIERLLELNELNQSPFVDVILMSRNSPDLSLRAFNSVEKHGLQIRTGSFTSGRSLAPYLPAWGIDLFLSNEASDVAEAVLAGTAAAKLGILPPPAADVRPGEVRVAFDGDAVVFSAESDQIYAERGLDAFLEHEKFNATVPMKGGPFGVFLTKLSLLRSVFLDADNISLVRIAIVTARNAPAHARVVHTLRAWGTPADEAHFVGRYEKAPILKAFGAHIFFDDQEKHVLGASQVVPAGHVPGPHMPGTPVIPAN